MRDTLLPFGMNLRESLILGLVGVGRIGFYIQMYMRAFQYEKVAPLAIIAMLFVVVIELASNAIWMLMR